MSAATRADRTALERPDARTIRLGDMADAELLAAEHIARAAGTEAHLEFLRTVARYPYLRRRLQNLRCEAHRDQSLVDACAKLGDLALFLFGGKLNERQRVALEARIAADRALQLEAVPVATPPEKRDAAGKSQRRKDASGAVR